MYNFDSLSEKEFLLHSQILKEKAKRCQRRKNKIHKDIVRLPSSKKVHQRKERLIKKSIQNTLLKRICLGCGELKKRCICLDSSSSEVAERLHKNKKARLDTLSLAIQEDYNYYFSLNPSELLELENQLIELETFIRKLEKQLT